MTLREVQETLNATVLWGDDLLSTKMEMVCGCDLMSDVLAFSKSGALLMTGLTNSQVVRTAEMAGVGAVCFVRGKKPDSDTIELARQKGIPLLATGCFMHEACGKLYEKGLRGCDINS